MREKRLKDIARYIKENGQVSTKDLSEHFSVSMNTILKDVTQLCEEGKARKVYGGVLSVDILEGNTEAVIDRTEVCRKERIGKFASEIVQPGETIFLDGSLASFMVPYLPKNQKITVITNSLEVVNKAVQNESIELLVIGGSYDRTDKTLTRFPYAKEVLDQIHISKSFISADAVSLHAGLTNNVCGYTDLRKYAMCRSENNIFLAEHEKFGKTASMCFCQLSKMNMIITDEMPELEFVQYAENHNIKLLF